MDCIVFNHHALPFDHPTAAEKAVPGFLKTCIQASNAGLRTILVDESLDNSWFRIELAAGYFWQDWYEQHQNEADIELIRAFRSIATQSPFFTDQDIDAGSDLFEVSFQDRTDYSAVRAAVWHDAPMSGFETRHPWNTTPLLVRISRMNPETADIETLPAQVQNFYNYDIFSIHLPEILQKRRDALVSGKEILALFEETWPGVFHCGKAAQQLGNWSGSNTILNQVKQALGALSQFAMDWQRGGFSHYSGESLKASGLQCRVSGESRTVRDNPDLRQDREFWLPRGEKKFFEQHIKLAYGYRLHFYPDNETRTIFVGYIGPHLKLK